MRFLAFILFVFSASLAFSEEKKYGSFTLKSELPNTLFVTSDLSLVTFYFDRITIHVNLDK